MHFIDEVVDGHEFDGGDAELSEVVDHRGMRESGIGAAKVLGHVGMTHGEPLDVGLVDDRVVPRNVEGLVAVPVEGRAHGDRSRHERRGVVVVAQQIVGADVAEHGRCQAKGTIHGVGVGILQQFGVVPAAPAGRIPWTVDAEPVCGALGHGAHVPVENPEGLLRQPDRGLGAICIEEAQVDRVGSRGPQGDVGPRGVECHAERVPRPGSIDLVVHAVLAAGGLTVLAARY